MKKLFYITIITAVVPFIVNAETGKKLSDLVGIIAGYLNQALALMMGFAIVMFVWYVVKYFIATAEVNRSEAAQYVMWSVIGFFVILSVWGIVNILINTFNLGTNAPSSWTGISNLFPR